MGIYMKLSFSTGYWPDADFENFLEAALEYRYGGLELHDIDTPALNGRGEPLSSSKIDETFRTLFSKGIEVACLDATVNIADTKNAEENKKTVLRYIETARRLRCPYIRLYAGKTDERSAYETDAAAKSFLAELIPAAEAAGVILLVETTGVYADTKRLCALLNHFACDNLAALWDMHHPWRFFGEEPEKTVENLGAYIRHIHVKDSVLNDGKVSFALMGEGELPVERMILALRSICYSGFISFEWDPAWLSDFADMDIILSQFSGYMSRWDIRRSPRLFENKAKTGKFIWEKDALIDLTFPQVLDRVVEEFPDQLAFKYTTLDYKRTYSQFRDDVDEFARALIALGVNPGAKVSVWATNVPQWYIAFWAAVKIGAVLVTVNTAYKIHEAKYLFRQSDTHTLIMIDGYRDSNYVEIIKEICPELEGSVPGKPLHCKELPFLRNVITIDSRQSGCLTWEDALSYAKKVPLFEVRRRAAQIDSHDVCNMQYTSGTTGFPKGVMLTHHSVVNNGKCIGDRMDLSTADRMMIHVPMFHCFGMVLAMTAAMTHSATLLPLPYFSPKSALTCINQERITCFHGVPTMFIAMLEHEDFPKTDFSYMRTGIMAGSPCPISVMRDVQNKMHMTEITIVYGQTEAAPGCTMSSTDDPIEVRVGTVGRALPKVECKIVDPNTGEDLPDNVTGEFVARGYNVMRGYYKMPAATAAAIDGDGWLHTGDLACRTPEGNYRITGRLKDMIIRGGENIYPKEIEEFLYTYPKVKDVQVVGVPDEQYGEEILACIILKDGESSTEAEIKDYVRTHMAKHKVPKYVDFVDSFPTNAAGKILKYKMREEAIERHDLKKASKIVTA